MSATSQRTKVLFLCTGNSCRSQIAEGYARDLKGATIDAYSAGIVAHGQNPNAIKVMAEDGIDITTQASKTLQSLLDAGAVFDVVYTVCGHADDNCPVFPGATRVVHHNFDDPPKLAKDAKTEEEALNHYRRVRDAIRAWIETL
ncbi:MAG: arsenate reductase ArsC [Sumerlaeia bacterium]